jgi:glycosyltransferase involved in cell wall biosynthesis
VTTGDTIRDDDVAPGDRRALRLTLVTSSLGSGGAERVMAVLADAWVAVGHDVRILTFEPPTATAHWTIDPRVDIQRLDLLHERRDVLDAVRHTVRRVRRLRAAIRDGRPDVVVSFMDRTNVLTLVSTLGIRAPVVVAEHNDPHEERPGRAWTMARRVAYRRAARVVVLTRSATRYFRGAVRRRVVVLPNPVVPPLGTRPTAARPAEREQGRIVAMGRLVPQKGFDRLLEAFARIGDRPGWTLTIHGEGPDRAMLVARCEALGLSGRVALPGVTSDPAIALAAADLFVLSSRWEGFPTVLGEAMALGRPVVAFDCPSGPADLIRDRVDGILVPRDDIDALAAAIAGLIDDPERRSALAGRAPEVTARFGLPTILDRWEELFANVVAPGHGSAVGVPSSPGRDA